MGIRTRATEASKVLGRFRIWIVAIAVGAIGGLLTAYFTDILRAILPPADALTCRLGELFVDWAPGTHFTILISDLVGDDDGRQTKLIRDVFLGQRGIDARRTCRVLELSGESIADAEARILVQGRGLLERRNADLLIWGEVKKADQELNIWFSAAKVGRRWANHPIP